MLLLLEKGRMCLLYTRIYFIYYMLWRMRHGKAVIQLLNARGKANVYMCVRVRSRACTRKVFKLEFK